MIYESGSGGEMAIASDDLVTNEVLYNQVYLALFGGNIEANTKADSLINEERFDWWGNQLFYADTQTKQFNSNTERTLQNVVLNSSGRLQIIQAVNEDLSYLSELLNSSVEVEFLDTNKIRIIVLFTRKSNQESKVLQLIYDNAKNEVIIENTI